MRLMNLLIVYAIFAVFALSCGNDSAIDLDLQGASDSSLRITDLRYLGQSPLSTEVLIFEVDFESQIESLFDGFVDVIFNSDDTHVISEPLKPIFLMNGLGPNAEKGTIRFSFEINFENFKKSRAVFEVAIRLRSLGGRMTNLPWVMLNVQQA